MMSVPSEPSSAELYIRAAEEAANAVPGDPIWADAAQEAGVIGAGTMGVGIAMSFLDAGFHVHLLETSEEALDRGVARVTALYDRALEKGRIDSSTHSDVLGRLSPSTQRATLSKADVIVEAVFEDMGVKHDVFSALDTIAKPGALLATNTSYLSVDAIAEATTRPQDVLGLHFFSPANLMRLCEVIDGPRTAQQTLARGLGIARRLKKLAIVSADRDGFIGNRMLTAYRLEAIKIALEGTPIQDIDAAMEGLGMPMGPFRMSDLAGLDIGYRNRKGKPAGSFDPREGCVADPLVEAGRLGQKTGGGYYDYAEGSRDPIVNPETSALFIEAAKSFGAPGRTSTSVEIVERCVLALANAGGTLVHEGVASCTEDVDLVYLNGYAFPKSAGGPMFWTKQRFSGSEAAKRMKELGIEPSRYFAA